MSEVQKQKQNPFPLRLEAQPKAKALRFQPGSIVGALETLSRVEMNAHTRAPLTAFPAPMHRSVLTLAVVLIHGMTILGGIVRRA